MASLQQPMILLFSSMSVPPTHTPLAAFLAHELPQSGPLESTLVLKAFPSSCQAGQSERVPIHLAGSVYGSNKGDGRTGCKGCSVCAGVVKR